MKDFTKDELTIIIACVKNATFKGEVSPLIAALIEKLEKVSAKTAKDGEGDKQVQ